jgi:hypothetical protein
VAQEAAVENLQTMEVEVSGPDGVNRMFTATGLAVGQVSASSSPSTDSATVENFFINVEPELAPQQYRRSIATVSLARIAARDWGAANDLWEVEIDDVDADYDDQAGKVRLRYTLRASSWGGGQSKLMKVAFIVTTIAEV